MSTLEAHRRLTPLRDGLSSWAPPATRPRRRTQRLADVLVTGSDDVTAAPVISNGQPLSKRRFAPGCPHDKDARWPLRPWRLSIEPAVQHRFDVQDWCAVKGFQIPHPEPGPLDRRDLNSVQSDGVRAGWGPGAEDSLFRVGRVTGVHPEHVTTCPIQPGQHDDFCAALEVAQTLAHGLVEDEPRVGRPFVTLFGCGVGIGQRRLDSPDRPQLKGTGHHGAWRAGCGWITAPDGGISSFARSGSRVCGRLITRRVTATFNIGITRFPISGTSTPVKTSAFSAGGSDSSWCPKKTSSPRTMRYATAHAASVVASRTWIR